MTASSSGLFPSELERADRRLILFGLIAVTSGAWGYLFYDAFSGVSACCVMPSTRPWRLDDLAILFVMWAVMMIAMMLPSITPMVLMFATVHRERKRGGQAHVDTWIFVLGYLLIWTIFSLVATVLQWGLHSVALLSPEMVISSRYFSAGVLLGAGAFQFTAFKRRCLTHCRSPIDFIMTDWREGRTGAVRMGLRHGLYCTGCCWMLMALLFVLGVMNLWWIAALTTFVILEKEVPAGVWLVRLAGLILIFWGIALLVLQLRGG